MNTESRMVKFELWGVTSSKGVIDEKYLLKEIASSLSCGARYASAKIEYDGKMAECTADECNKVVYAFRHSKKNYQADLKEWANTRATKMMQEVGLII